MTSTRPPTSGLLRNSWWLLTIGPFAFLLYTVLRFSVPVPFLDQWDLVPLLEKMYNGTLTLGDLWILHNEHRLLFPQMIMLGLAWLTGWNIYYELATNILLALGTFLLLVFQVRITIRKLDMPELNWAIPLFSIIVFSVSQYQNWLWGWQLQMFLSVFGVMGSIVLLANPPFSWFRFSGAAALSIVASYSFGNGGVSWLAGLFVLVVVIDSPRQRSLRIAVWLLLSALTMGLYFYRYERLEEHPPLTLLFSAPGHYLIYVFKYLGNICAQYARLDPSTNGTLALVCGIAGLGTLVWAFLAIRRNKVVELKVLAPYLAMSLYSIGSALVIGVGRVGLGADQAISSRYCTVTAPFWASLVTLLLILQRKTLRPQRKAKASAKPRHTSQERTTKWVLPLVIIPVVLSSILAVNGAANMSLSQDVGQQLLLAIPVPPTPGTNYSLLGKTLHQRPETVLERFPFLKRHGLSVFREKSSSASPPQR